MSDDQNQAKPRNAADKERSRQQSRAVSGREAAKAVGQKGRTGGNVATKSRPGAGGNAKSTGGKTGRAAAQRASTTTRKPAGRSGPGNRRPAARRSRTAMYAWGSVGLVVVLVVTLVVIATTRSGPATPTTSPTAYTPAAASVVRDVTHVPASVFDTVGITSPAAQISPPHVANGQPLETVDGKPGLLYVGGEFCPFCAADRWTLTTALARFGTFHGLGAMSSSPIDTFPNTPTFTYYHTTYTSPYLGANLVEQVSAAFNRSTGNYDPLEPLTPAETALATKYSSSKFLGAGASQSAGLSIPFVDIGNKVLISGAPFSPSILAGETRAQIAAGLHDPTNPITQAIVASSNYYSAALCATDGAQPAAVCTSHGVTVAANAMHLKL